MESSTPTFENYAKITFINRESGFNKSILRFP